MLTPIKKTGKRVLYIQIADAIMEYIRDNKLEVGDKLPSERFLSEALKISRNSVREALRFLETQGIITVHTGIGSFIASDCSDRSVSLQFTQLNYQETLEVKTSLEVLLASKLIYIITDEQLNHLDSLIDSMNDCKAEGRPFHEPDLKFHKYLYELSPNSTLKDMLSDILTILDNYWSQFGDFPDDIGSLRFHRDIADGFRNKDLFFIQKSYNEMLDYDIKLFKEHSKMNDQASIIYLGDVITRMSV